MLDKDIFSSLPASLKKAADRHISDGYKIISYDNDQLVLSKRVRLKWWKIILSFYLGIYILSPLLVYQDIVGAKYFILLKLNGKEVESSTR